jgi:hypothetical protein
MNERFKQLAQQAFYDEATSQPSNQMYTFSEYKMEKFAKLIVAECIELAGNHYDARSAVNDIKQHFGVEL